jgi:hypothetical protein
VAADRGSGHVEDHRYFARSEVLPGHEEEDFPLQFGKRTDCGTQASRDAGSVKPLVDLRPRIREYMVGFLHALTK